MFLSLLVLKSASCSKADFFIFYFIHYPSLSYVCLLRLNLVYANLEISFPVVQNSLNKFFLILLVKK